MKTSFHILKLTLAFPEQVVLVFCELKRDLAASSH